MKRILLIFIILFSFTVNSFSKIVFIDVNLILNTSDVGKALKKYIKQVSNEHSIDFNRIEKNLVTKEQELIAQQNIIDKSEFEKKLSDLSEEINKYRSKTFILPEENYLNFKESGKIPDFLK